MKGNNMLTIMKDKPFKIRWKFTTESGEKVNRTCQVLFTGVTLPSENGVSYEILNIKQTPSLTLLQMNFLLCMSLLLLLIPSTSNFLPSRGPSGLFLSEI